MESKFLSDRLVVLVRHPETEANVAGLLVGRTDSPWTSRGHEQAQQVVSQLAEFGVTDIVTSPLDRAVKLAEKIAEHHNLEVVHDARMIEIDFGSFEGRSYRDMHLQISEDFDNALDLSIGEGGESRRDVDARISGFVHELMDGEGVTVVVGHGGTIRSALTQLLCLDANQCWSFNIRNASIVVISVDNGRGFLEMLV